MVFWMRLAMLYSIQQPRHNQEVKKCREPFPGHIVDRYAYQTWVITCTRFKSQVSIGCRLPFRRGRWAGVWQAGGDAVLARST